MVLFLCSRLAGLLLVGMLSKTTPYVGRTAVPLPGMAKSSRLSSQTNNLASAKEFVSAFLRWYVPHANQTSSEPTYWLVLSQRNAWLTPQLSRLLRQDSLAVASHSQSREILNFDPFLASQDPCSSYAVVDGRKASARTYVVRVVPRCSEEMTPTQAGVEYVLTRGANLFRIADVHYDNGSLRKWLCQYARDGKDGVMVKTACLSP